MIFWVYWIAVGVIGAGVGLIVWRQRKRRQRKAPRDIRKELIAWAMEMEDLGIISSHHYDDLIPDRVRKPPRDGVLLPKILVDQLKELTRKIHVIHHEEDPTEYILGPGTFKPLSIPPDARVIDMCDKVDEILKDDPTERILRDQEKSEDETAQDAP